MVTALTVTALLVFFFYWNASFIFYRDRAKHKLEKHEEKCFSPECRSIVKDNGSDTGYFFIHGYPTTPNMYKYPCEKLSETGCDVYAPLIPTFGADPLEFAETNYTEWFNFIKKEYEEFRKKHIHTHVVGVSMGGATTLKLAEVYSGTPYEMDTITVIAAPVTYNSFLRDRIVTDKAAYIVRTVALFTHAIKPGIVDGKDEKADGDEEWRGYSGIYPKTASSFIRNLRTIRRELSKITVPLLSIHDRGDKTVPFENQKIIVDSVSSRVIEKEIREMDEMGHSKHSLLMYHSTRESVTDSIIRFTQGGKK